jgi:hypothetical protein
MRSEVRRRSFFPFPFVFVMVVSFEIRVAMTVSYLVMGQMTAQKISLFIVVQWKRPDSLHLAVTAEENGAVQSITVGYCTYLVIVDYQYCLCCADGTVRILFTVLLKRSF